MLRNALLGVGLACMLMPIATHSPAAATANIVLTPAHATHHHGHWSIAPDPAASTAVALTTTDQQWSSPDAALAEPTHYVEFPFVPLEKTPYRVWVRLRATGNSVANDSLYVQFSNAYDAAGKRRYQIGSTEGLIINLQSCDGCAVDGWGWVDGAYWRSQMSTLTFQGAPSHVLRIQTREDGVVVDQIVLSPQHYLTTAPGAVIRDTTFVAAPPPQSSTPMGGTLTLIPGLVAAENFDEGPAGVAYHDTTSGNSGGAYRSTDVDIQRVKQGVHTLTAIAPGEWLNYSVGVTDSGEYRLDARVASKGVGATFHVNANGRDLTGPLTIPNTKSSTAWTTVSAVVRLERGPQTLKLIFDARNTDMGHFSSMEFTVVSLDAPPEPPPLPPPPSPPPPPPPPPPPEYTTHVVAAGGDFQAALNAAEPGDLILLEAGATFVGNFVLPAKTGDGYITIRSSASDSALPPAGVRINPSYAPYLPKVRSPNSAAVIATAAGAHHYRLQFLELQANYQGYGNILNLGDGSKNQNSLDLVPYDLVVDRVYIHGDPTYGQKRGIALNSASTSIVNSYISDIKAVGQDAQAIAGWNGPGPYLIDNNFLEGAGENVLFGGADPAIQNLVPSDITFTRNHLYKPWSWRGSNWVVKNLFELKSAQRVLVDGNLMENNWLAGQAGYAILLKSVNQDGNAPWSVVQDVVISNNIVRHTGSAVNILGRETRYPALEANNITFRNNLFYDVSGARYGGPGRFIQIVGGIDITFDHNTAINDGAVTVAPDVRETFGFVFTNNIILDNAYGIKGAGTASGNATIAKFFPGSVFLGSIMARSPAAQYPVGNYYPVTIDDVGFIDYQGGDYRLGTQSMYRFSATDGTDPGVDYDKLAHALAVAQ